MPEPVRSLKGLSVVVTGRLERDGEWVRREEALRLARLAGAYPRKPRVKASFHDDLLVIGSSAQWKYGSYGTQEERVLGLQDAGSRIRIIDQDGFFALLAGGWAYPLFRDTSPVEYADGFLAYRPVDPNADVSGYAWSTDGSALTTALGTHRRLQEEVAEKLHDRGLVPFSAGWDGCAFDVAWEGDATVVHVVEVKSLPSVRRHVR